MITQHVIASAEREAIFQSTREIASSQTTLLAMTQTEQAHA